MQTVLRRLRNLTSYLRLSRIKAALCLLSSDERQRWIHYLNIPPLSNFTPDNAVPWFTFKAIDYVDKIVNVDMKVLEYGSGYSTIWWAARVAEVISIERSKKWYEAMMKVIAKNDIHNVKIYLIKELPEVEGDDVCEHYSPKELESIVNKYVFYTNPKHSSFDIVVVDDVFRNIVMKHATEFLKPGGLLILDNSDRDVYQSSIEMLTNQKWNFAIFSGAGPYHFGEWQTTIFHKPLS